MKPKHWTQIPHRKKIYNNTEYYEVYWGKEASDITEDWRELEQIKRKFYTQLNNQNYVQ